MFGLSDASQQNLSLKPEDLWSFISLLGALIAFSFVPVFTKWGAIETSSATAIFDRFFLTTIILGLVWGVLAIYRQLTESPNQSPPRSQQLSHPVQLLGLFLITGTFLAGMLLTLAWSLIQTTVANCELINNLTPVFTILGGWLLFKQRFNRRFLVGCAIAVSGLLIIGFNDFQLGIDKLQGDLLALVSALFLAAYLLGAEQLRTQLHTDTVLLGCFGCGTPLTLMVLAITHESLFPSSWQSWLPIVSMSVSGLLAQGLLLYSLKRLSSGFVALVFLVTPFTTAIIAWMMFSETLSLSNLLAFCVVVLGLSLSISSSSTVKQIEENI
jgi:drug/metabolite transporter (DMT)-like permease